MCYTYIFYSKSKDSYYVGSTRDNLAERVRRHTSNHKGYTGWVFDWAAVFSKQLETHPEAREMELKIKSWKSREMIESLIAEGQP